MTPFCKVDSLTYFITGMSSFLQLKFFCHNFSDMKKISFFYILSP
ncbi:unnamed protein product, partial [Staurois parvus]